jgi:drug/metabolite transporter (DMT)-like permease
MIYTTAATCGILIVLTTKRGMAFSKEGFLSGITANIGAITMLYTLASNQVLVVFSFVSFASVIFFLIILVFEKPRLSSKQESVAVIGILVAVFGLFLASTLTAGGINYLMNNSAVNWHFLVRAPVMPIGFGFWAYFSFVAIKKEHANVPTVCLNYSLASFVVAAIVYLLFGLSFPLPVFSQLTDCYPIIVGLFVMGGVALTLKSYQLTSGESRIEETMVAILANAEMVPLIFLSYFILREITMEGLVGALTVFIGLSILNSAIAR